MRRPALRPYGGLTRALHRHYASEADDAWLATANERIRGRVLQQTHARTADPRRRVRVPRWTRRAAVVIVVVACATTAAFAVNSIVNLGKPTNAVPQSYFPLSGFHHVGRPVMQGHRVELIVIGTQYEKDLKSAVERWPVVKALDQFGSFSEVRPLERVCHDAKGTRIPLCSIPSYDWTRARYTSPLVSFVHADLLRSNGEAFQPLTGSLLSLYNRSSRIPGSAPGDPLNARATVANESSQRTLPLVAAGGYIQTVSQALTQDGFEEMVNVPQNPSDPLSPGMATPSGIPFNSVHSYLASGRAPRYSSLIYAVNAEANVITALICRADGVRPATVCRRPAIMTLVKKLR